MTAQHRRTRLLLSALLLAALFLAPGPCRAWDDEGHMLVAAIAYRSLLAEPGHNTRAAVDGVGALVSNSRVVRVSQFPGTSAPVLHATE